MSNEPGGIAFSDDGEPEPFVMPDFDAIDGEVFDREDSKLEMSPEEIEVALKMFRTMVEWQFQNGMSNPNGLKIRAIIVCWVFLERLHSMTLTEMARGFGMKKQSLGRWVDEFKIAFPYLKTEHMKTT